MLCTKVLGRVLFVCYAKSAVRWQRQEIAVLKSGKWHISDSQ
jgi:hypothetical protein